MLRAVSYRYLQKADKMPKLTETLVKRISPTKSGTDKFWDSEIKGFVLFVGKRSKTWYFQKDVGGQTKRELIGRYPLISAQVARRTALGYALEWGRGSGKNLQMGVPTLEEAMEVYLARPKLRSEAYMSGLRQQFDNHLKDWLKLPIDEISKSMVVERHRRLSDRPSTANHTLKYFRTIWNHTRRTHDLAESPTMAIEWIEERPKGGIIEDLQSWRRQIEALTNPIHQVFYELILFTGLRKSEAFSLKWEDVHTDHLHIPMTKNGRSFDLPITQKHHEILVPVKGLSHEWVFPSYRSFSGYINQPEKIAWSPHAHRRTFATVAVEAGIMEEIVGRLLNHTPLSITGQRYAKPSIDALRPSIETVCEELSKRIKCN